MLSHTFKEYIDHNISPRNERENNIWAGVAICLCAHQSVTKERGNETENKHSKEGINTMTLNVLFYFELDIKKH